METKVNGSSADQQMPCPRCRRLHKRGEYVKRPDLQTKAKGVPIGPQDVICDCGAKLRHTVPIFMIDVFGWHWRIM